MSADLPDMTAHVVARSRARERNTRAVITSLGLIALAMLCLYLVFGAVHFKHTPPAVKVGIASHHAPVVPPPTRRAAATTAAPTTTTTTPAPTTSVSAPTGSPPITGPPQLVMLPTTVVPTTAAPTTIPVTTTTKPAVTATVSVSDAPNWCTVVVTLSTGAQGVYDLAPYLAVAGDSYLFDATIGGYTMHVSTTVVTRNGGPECVSTVTVPTHG